METLTNALYRGLIIAVTVLLAVLTLVVTYQVAGRYVPFIPRAIWTDEISRLCLAWLVFLGAALAVRRNEHFVLDVIPQRFEDRHRTVVQTVILVFLGLAAVVMIVGGVGFVEAGLARTSTTTGLSLAWSFAALPVGGAATLIFVLELGLRSFRGESVKEIGTALEELDPGPDTDSGSDPTVESGTDQERSQ